MVTLVSGVHTGAESPSLYLTWRGLEIWSRLTKVAFLLL